MTAYIVLGFVGAVLVAWWVLDTLVERTAEWRDIRAFQRSGREAAKAWHPAGKQRPVGDEWDIHIPPSVEVRDHGHGKSVADAAADDHIRLHLEATWAMPDARKEARP